MQHGKKKKNAKERKPVAFCFYIPFSKVHSSKRVKVCLQQAYMYEFHEADINFTDSEILCFNLSASFNWH
jgi:hypothetical protein